MLQNSEIEDFVLESEEKMDVVRRLEQAEYYVDLLFKMIDEEKCPFYSLIIKKKLVKRY